MLFVFLQFKQIHWIELPGSCQNTTSKIEMCNLYNSWLSFLKWRWKMNFKNLLLHLGIPILSSVKWKKIILEWLQILASSEISFILSGIIAWFHPWAYWQPMGFLWTVMGYCFWKKKSPCMNCLRQPCCSKPQIPAQSVVKLTGWTLGQRLAVLTYHMELFAFKTGFPYTSWEKGRTERRYVNILF